MKNKDRNIIDVSVDSPIEKVGDDKLGRAKAAESVATYLLKLDASQGLVAGIFGSWGSGKTSFVNMVKEYLNNKAEGSNKKSLLIVDFNPWIFSGSEQIIEKFFSEISKKLSKYSLSHRLFGRRFLAYGKKVKASSNVISNILSSTTGVVAGFVVGVPYIGAAISFLVYPLTSSLMWMLGISSDVDKARKRAIEKADRILKRKNRRIFVVIDDVDRLSDNEMKDIFKLIRLIANMPNIIFVVACDRDHVSQALTRVGFSGQSYLEKIVQFHYSLPEVSKDAMDRVYDDIVLSDFVQLGEMNEEESQRLEDVYREIISPLITNVRDAYRYRAVLWESIINLEDQVSLIDIMALKAIQLFLPSLIDAILNNIDDFAIGYNAENYKLANIKLQESQDSFENVIDSRIKILEEGIRVTKVSIRSDKIIEGIVRYIYPPAFESQPKYKYESYFENASWEVEQFREQRVAHKTILLYCLTCAEDDDLKYAKRSKEFFQYMLDEEEEREEKGEKASSYLNTFNFEQRSEIILRLRYYESDFMERGRHVGFNMMAVLWSTIPRLTDYSIIAETHILDNIKTITRMIIGKVPEDLMPSGHFLDSLKNIESLSAKVELVELIKNYEHPSKAMVVRDIMDRAEEELYLEIMDDLNNNNGDIVSEEWGAPEIILYAGNSALSRGYPFDIPQSSKLATAVAQRARIEGENIGKYCRKIFNLGDTSSTQVSSEMISLIDQDFWKSTP